MVRPGRERLHGSVEVDETYVGGAATGGKRGRGAEDKEIVVIAVEVLHPKGFGRIRMRRVPDVSGDSLVPFIRDVAEDPNFVMGHVLRGHLLLGWEMRCQPGLRPRRRSSRGRPILRVGVRRWRP